MVSKLDRIKGEIALWARLRWNRLELEKLQLHLCFVSSALGKKNGRTGYNTGVHVWEEARL